MNNTAAPLIFDIRRFALDDGPGIRTTVFFKGCPLACAWCHNPESQNPAAEIAFRGEVCIECGECREICPQGAIHQPGSARIDRQRCDACGRCAEHCPTTALRLVGEPISVEALLAALIRDRLFYKTSGGGVTFSGGEPTLHADFLADILPRLRRHGIHITLQTCGHFDSDRFRRLLLPHLDLIHYDLKLADPALHRRHTGRDNALILANFRWLAAEARSRLVPRLPLVPGLTASRENLTAIAALLREEGFEHCQFLPYHPGGLAKQHSLGRRPADWLPKTMLNSHEEGYWKGLLERLLRGKAGGRPTAQPGGMTIMDRAAFARPEYDAWWRIWEEEGWVSLGRFKNYDWMHVQAAKL